MIGSAHLIGLYALSVSDPALWTRNDRLSPSEDGKLFNLLRKEVIHRQLPLPMPCYATVNPLLLRVSDYIFILVSQELTCSLYGVKAACMPYTVKYMAKQVF